MATTITLAKGAVNSYNPYVTLSVSESSTSATANTSTLSYTLTLYRPSSVSSSSSKSYTITINGTAHSGTTTIGGSGSKTVTSGTQTVTHSSDGTKSITIKLSFTFGLTWNGTSMGTYSGSTTMTLTSLDRTAPTITISSTSVTNSTIYFAAKSDVSCNTWQYSTNGGSSYTTFKSGSATSVTKTISGLSANTTYSLRVRAYKVANNISSYASKSVTTLGASTITSASSVTMSDDGTACAVKFTPYSTSYYFTIKFTCGSKSVTTSRFKPGTTSAYTYTGYSFVTSTWAPYITSAASATCTALLTTYANSSTSTAMGTSSKTFTLKVPSSVVPTVGSLTVSEGGSLPDAFSGVYVQSLSQLDFAATASGTQGSTISGISFAFNSASYAGAEDDDGAYTASTDAVTVSGDYTVTATATDSRGYTAAAEEEITVYEYSSPTVSGLTFDISGTACKVTATGACSSVNTLNSAYITFTAVCVSDTENTQTAEYTKTVDGDEWASSGAYSFSHTFTLDTVQTETYKITFEIEDETGTSATLSKQTGVICFSRLAGGKGAAFFKEAESEGLEVAGDTTLDGTLTVAGDTTLDGVTSINNKMLYLENDGSDSSDTMMKTTRTDTAYRLGFGIGSGGANRGIYDYAAASGNYKADLNGSGSWMLYKDSSNNIRLGVSGDSIYIGGYPRFTGSSTINIAGYLTGSNVYIYFTIPYIAYGASPTLDITGLKIRQDGSYLFGSASATAVPASYTCTYYRMGYFWCRCTFSSSIGGTNNSPVGIYCEFTVS